MRFEYYCFNGNPVEKISDGWLLDTAPKYCIYWYGGEEKDIDSAKLSGNGDVSVKQMLEISDVGSHIKQLL